MSNQNMNLVIKTELRDRLFQSMSSLLKEKAELKQNIRNNSNDTEAEKDALFLELLEVIDTLDNLTTSLENSLEALPESHQRLPRAIGSIQRKLLMTLQKQDVYPIVIPEKEAVDVNLCRILESENRDDLPERSLVKILKTGYMNGDKVLRSAEVIVAKSTSPKDAD
ncbi:nucleotide exchange factor GrpE [Pseudanabaena sp. FACHB-1277]|uniref:Nucleotide exchange factor GrpE n=1 Tax=Pseudanabaena cinerea FACHB-1277 TaxID=2949581 RepID=A0A926UR76_9CYAN|nr:nucleotide exchange factor GrpE [Pseudanabaena cinerea]MBD2149756.1 nucleotide exchange factor GrpE [Pseudanabaena cinerea FACHB-1277]